MKSCQLEKDLRDQKCETNLCEAAGEKHFAEYHSDDDGLTPEDEAWLNGEETASTTIEPPMTWGLNLWNLFNLI